MQEGNEYKNIEVNAHNVHMGNVYGSNQLKDPDVNDLLGDLFVTDASEDLAKTMRLKGKRVSGTCEWLPKTREYQRWASGESLELLWLIGVPGIGKTVVSCFVVEELQRQEKEVASMILVHYFCDSKDDKRSTVLAILRGLLFQLLKKRPNLFELIKEDFKIQRASIVTRPDFIWRALVRMLQSCGNDQVYIVIDALDECDETSRRDFLAFLEEVDNSVKAKILITGRPETDIEETAGSVGRVLRLDSGKINDDLSTFIDIRIADLREKKKDYPTKLVDDIRSALQDKAGGTFLWASLVLKDIATAKTSKAARKKLEGLPSDLPEVYKRILKNISEDDTGDAILILQWVVVSRRPMTVCELATAQAIASGEWHGDTVPPSDVLNEFMDGFKACGPLLYHDPDINTVNLIHQSAKDYLVKTDCVSGFRVNREETSLSILNTCWAYLSKEEFSHGEAIIAKADEANELKLQPLSKRAVSAYGFLSYATEELRDGELEDRLDLLASFIRRCETCHDLPTLRDFWLLAFAEKDHFQGVQALIEKGANLNVTVHSKKMGTPLQIAIRNRNDTITMLLLDNGADFTYRTSNGETLLHVAAEVGSLKICRLLIEKGADVNAMGRGNGETVLHVAAINGHLDVISLLLERGADINQKNNNKCTAFFEAVQAGVEEPALLLAKNGADITMTGIYGTTPLMAAVGAGFLQIVKLLIEHQVDVNEPQWGKTPLSFAVENGYADVARLLISHGADVKWRDNNQRTLLYIAAEAGDKDMVRMFLEEESDVNSTGEYYVATRELGGTLSSRSALQIAAVQGNRDVVEFLIEAGADLSTGNIGPSPLFLAAKYGHDSTVKYLLQSGANIEQRDDRGWTALHRAARSAEDAIVTILITAGAILEGKDQQGWSALHHAVEKGHGETVLLLLSKGADIDARANDGRTPLQIVSRMGSVHLERKGGGTRNTLEMEWCNLTKQKRDAAMVQLLLKHNANVTMTNSNGLTALHLAAADGNETITNMLLKHRTDIDATDNTGMTPLLWASGKVSADRSSDSPEETHEGVAQILIDHRANVNAMNSDGRTPLFIAAANELKEMSYILLNEGADCRAIATPAETSLIYPKMDQLVSVIEQWRKEHGIFQIPRNLQRDGSEEKTDTGLVQITKLLFEIAASIKAKSEPNSELLTNAARKGYDAVVTMLLRSPEPSSTISRKDKAWALHEAARSGNEKVVRIMLDSGVDFEPKEGFRQGWSAISEAAGHGHEAVVRLLIDRGADVRGVEGTWTPFLKAAFSGHYKATEMLLDAGANILDYIDSRSAITGASSNGYADVVRMLLERGGEVYAKRGDIGKALVAAVQGSQDEVVRVLLSSGADLAFQNYDLDTALQQALEMNYTEAIVLLLLRYGANPRSRIAGRRDVNLLSYIMRFATEKRSHLTMELLKSNIDCFDLDGKDGQILLIWAIEKGYSDIESCLLRKGVKMNIKVNKML